MQKIAFESLKVGMTVWDEYGTRGKVTECDDPHNVVVKYRGGNSGFYCLVEGCEEVMRDDKYEWLVKHYSPLFVKS